MRGAGILLGLVGVGVALTQVADVDLPQNYDLDPATWSNDSPVDDERELDQREDMLDDRETGDPLVGL